MHFSPFFQTHTAVSRLLDTFEATEKISFPNKDRVLQAYLHFEALTDHEYMYACISCGYNPSVIVMDLHKKGVFNMPGELDKMLFHKMYSLNAFTIAPFSKLLSSQQYYNYNGVKILDFFLFDFSFGAACSHDLFFSC